ncbi:hypothetical protein BH24ACT5_BH24ACT5_04990 [soil metagenome]
MIAEIHVSPCPAGTPEGRYEHVEAAIAVVRSSGLHVEVGALGTTFEGEPDAVWHTLRAAHEAVIASGADGLITNIRLGQRSADGITMDALTAKFRT